MKSLLNIVLIAIFGSFANAITSSGLKTLPSSSIKTTTASTTAQVSDIKYYTTIVTNNNFEAATLIIPNNAMPNRQLTCIPTKRTTSEVNEYCTSTSSTTYCEPRTTTRVFGERYCTAQTKKLSFTIPVSTKTCTHYYEKCKTVTRKFSETVLPLDSYYKEIIKSPLVGLPLTSSKSLSSVIEKLPSYTYQ